VPGHDEPPARLVRCRSITAVSTRSRSRGP
jgi:hypothetical protein